ncbi:MAG: UDP-N-acetylmuramate dehydrogenase, partial [bacterium]
FNNCFNKVEINNSNIIAEAGATTLQISTLALEKKLTGFEIFYDIPSSVGGAVVMNAGTKVKEIKDILEKVQYLDLQDMQIKETLAKDIGFEYRNSFFQKNKDKVILKAWFKLKPGFYDDIKALMENEKQKRWAKQPRDLPNCGSVFKRPQGFYVGQMIEELGLKGFAIGGAKVSEKHAGFIVNYNNATLSVFKYLKKFNNDLYLLVSGDSNKTMISEFEDICEEVFIDKEIGYSKYLMRSLNTSKIKSIINNYSIDCVFAQDFKALVASMSASIKAKKPIIFTKAGGPVDSYFPPKEIPTIVFSKELFDGMQKRYNLNSENLIYIPERIDCKVYKPTKNISNYMLDKYIIGEAFILFMAVRFENSKMSYIKAVFEIIKSRADELGDIKLFIAGDGTQKENVLNLIEELNAEKEKVHYLGKIYDQNKLCEIYNNVDMVIGSGRGILEPMACGTNVVLAENIHKAVDINGYNFEILKYWNFSIRAFNEIKNYKDLYSIIKEYKDNKIDKSVFNRELILENYDSEIGARKLYETLLNNRKVRLKVLDKCIWVFKFKVNYNLKRLSKHLGF